MRIISGARRGILTLAYGDRAYVQMAKSLAVSLKLHNPTIPRVVVTESSDPALRRLYDLVIPVNSSFGRGVAQKLHLNRYSPFTETLFIDADSLVVKPIEWLWDLFSDVAFGVVGRQITEGNWFMDVPRTLKQFGLKSIPQFNGGLYYFTNDARSTAVFETSGSILRDYEGLGLHPFRGGVNDEPIVALALAIHGIPPVDDQGRAMRTPIGIRGRLDVDVLRGVCRFNKQGTEVEPAIIHFAGDDAEGFCYWRERLKLLLGHRITLKPVVSYAVNALTNPANLMYQRWQLVKESWKMNAAARRLRAMIPRQSAFILVNQDAWPADQWASGRRTFPFLEKDGRYMGIPEDDETAIHELERLRREGAAFIAFASPALWYLDHFSGLRQYLYETYRCVAEDERLVLFQLEQPSRSLASM